MAVITFQDMLTLDPAGPASWTGGPGPGVGPRLFGGHALAQALMAASLAEDSPRLAHSLHAHFLSPGLADRPVRFDVETIAEGKSFARRRVDARQDGAHLLTMIVSFQVDEDGFSHSAKPPSVGKLDDARRALDAWCEAQDEFESLPIIGRIADRPIDVVPLEVEALFGNIPHPPKSGVWMRARDPAGAPDAMTRSQLAYASDMLFLRNALLPHGVRPGEKGIQISSLDHAIWFHRNTDFSQWHLYATESPWAGKARGLSRGHFFDADGELVATVTQENLMRITDDRLEGSRQR